MLTQVTLKNRLTDILGVEADLATDYFMRPSVSSM